MSFRPLDDTPSGWLHNSFAVLAVLFAGATFLSTFLYLKVVLRRADRSRVVPDRVRAALNTVAEGVLVLDREQRIALANDAFARQVGRPAEALTGALVQELPCVVAAPSNGAELPFPWARTI